MRGLRPRRITLKLRVQSSWAKARLMPSVAPVMRAQGADDDGDGESLAGDGVALGCFEGRR